MEKKQYTSNEIQSALKEYRSIFLDKKITIDDISNDIRLLESDLNNQQIYHEFTYTLDTGLKCIFKEDTFASLDHGYDLGSLVPHWKLERRLIWKKHGNKWRIFYCIFVSKYRRLSDSNYECNHPEHQEGFLPQQDSDRSHTNFHFIGGESFVFKDFEIFDIKDNKELLLTPLIDTSKEVRTYIHSYLPKFIKALAENYQNQ